MLHSVLPPPRTWLQEVMIRGLFSATELQIVRADVTLGLNWERHTRPVSNVESKHQRLESTIAIVSSSCRKGVTLQSPGISRIPRRNSCTFSRTMSHSQSCIPAIFYSIFRKSDWPHPATCLPFAVQPPNTMKNALNTPFTLLSLYLCPRCSSSLECHSLS